MPPCWLSCAIFRAACWAVWRGWASIWKLHKCESFDERQRKVINRLLDNFEGKLTSSKWAKLTKCSQDTAGRDINDLLDRKILAKEVAGGRSTS